MIKRPGWRVALLHAGPITLFLLGLFYDWFAVADRYKIFLYNHLGATPFDQVTRSRYWMSGLVASGAVLILYALANWLAARGAGFYGRSYVPPAWWQVWLLSLLPLAIGIPLITMNFNQPTLPFSLALACVAATLIGLALALWPGLLAARRPRKLVGLGLASLGFIPSLLLLRAVELPARGLVDAPLAYLMAVGGTLAGAVWLIIITWLYAGRNKSYFGAKELLLAGLGLNYLLLPLLHHLFFVPAEFRYITTAGNFFAFNYGIQLLSWLATAALAVGVVRWQQQLRSG